MEENKTSEVKQKTSAQDILILKIMKSGKILDKEYRNLNEMLKTRVVTSYDASVFIEYVLGMLKFRRHFFNGKHKAYKKCNYCNSRKFIKRYTHLATATKLWVCEECALNLDIEKYQLSKGLEAREMKADLHRKYEMPELTSSQEDLINSHREE